MERALGLELADLESLEGSPTAYRLRAREIAGGKKLRLEDGTERARAPFAREWCRLFVEAADAMGQTENIGKPEARGDNYAFKTVSEFTAESFSNEAFQNRLREVADPARKGSLWDSLVDVVRKFFKLPPRTAPPAARRRCVRVVARRVAPRGGELLAGRDARGGREAPRQAEGRRPDRPAAQRLPVLRPTRLPVQRARLPRRTGLAALGRRRGDRRRAATHGGGAADRGPGMVAGRDPHRVRHGPVPRRGPPLARGRLGRRRDGGPCTPHARADHRRSPPGVLRPDMASRRADDRRPRSSVPRRGRQPNGRLDLCRRRLRFGPGWWSEPHRAPRSHDRCWGEQRRGDRRGGPARRRRGGGALFLARVGALELWRLDLATSDVERLTSGEHALSARSTRSRRSRAARRVAAVRYESATDLAEYRRTSSASPAKRGQAHRTARTARSPGSTSCPSTDARRRGRRRRRALGDGRATLVRSTDGRSTAACGTRRSPPEGSHARDALPARRGDRGGPMTCYGHAPCWEWQVLGGAEIGVFASDPRGSDGCGRRSPARTTRLG